MPLATWTVGKTLLLPAMSTTADGPALFLGICLVGCSPGGTASNLVSLIAQADVALSLILTACSTLLAVVMTPLLVWVKLLVGSEIQVSSLALCQATARVVLLPVLLGMLLKAKTPKLADTVSRFTPFCFGLVGQFYLWRSCGLEYTTLEEYCFGCFTHCSYFGVIVAHTGVWRRVLDP